MIIDNACEQSTLSKYNQRELRKIAKWAPTEISQKILAIPILLPEDQLSRSASSFLSLSPREPKESKESKDLYDSKDSKDSKEIKDNDLHQKDSIVQRPEIDVNAPPVADNSTPFVETVPENDVPQLAFPVGFMESFASSPLPPADNQPPAYSPFGENDNNTPQEQPQEETPVEQQIQGNEEPQPEEQPQDGDVQASTGSKSDNENENGNEENEPDSA